MSSSAAVSAGVTGRRNESYFPAFSSRSWVSAVQRKSLDFRGLSAAWVAASVAEDGEGECLCVPLHDLCESVSRATIATTTAALLTAQTRASIEHLHDVMTDPQVSDSVRVRAAGLLLTEARAWRDADMEPRLVALEEAAVRQSAPSVIVIGHEQERFPEDDDDPDPGGCPSRGGCRSGRRRTESRS
jgi:hypothetical protein